MTILRVLALVIALAGLPFAASAESRAVCEQYARDAVTAQKLSQARRCELRGDPWSLDERNHFNWCLKQDAAALRRENRNRDSHLARCERCTDYAHAAVDSQRANLRRHCGQSGNLWSENERDHYRWCTRVSKVEAARHAEERESRLERCPG